MLAALQQELILHKDYLEGQLIETVYLGGGTPSLLTAGEINSIGTVIRENYNCHETLFSGTSGTATEFTLEANPDDLSKDYLESLKQTPVGRLSIGVQSFFDSDLTYMNRAHNAGEALKAIKMAQDSGFSNLSIDLIYGTPGLSNEAWLQNLAYIKELQLPHFSSYALTVEEGTVLHNHIKRGLKTCVDTEQTAQQLELLMQFAQENGYEHYEISNFALPGHYAVHNTNYWRAKHYLGIGPSAHSFNGNSRSWNCANNALYIKNIVSDLEKPAEQRGGWRTTEVLSSNQQINEYIMTSLRTQWGCDLSFIDAQWGKSIKNHLLKEAEIHILNGHLKLQEQALVLSPAGKLFADGIAADLFL